MRLWKMDLVVLISLVLVMPRIGVASTPVQDINDTKLVEQATSDILGMSEKELEAFVEYYSSCRAYAPGDVKAFYCEKTRLSYGMKYGQQRAIDRLIFALYMTDQLIASVDRTSKPNPTQKKQVTDMLVRLVDVKQELEHAVTLSYSRFWKR